MMPDPKQKLKDEIDAINARAWELWEGDIERARSLLEQAYTLSTTQEFAESHYHKGQIISLIRLGHIDRISGNLYQAMNCLTEAQRVSEETGLFRAVRLGQPWQNLHAVRETSGEYSGSGRGSGYRSSG